MRIFALLLLLSLALGAEEEFLEAAERDAFLDKVSKAMDSVKSFGAAFDQEKELKVFKETVKSRGQILFQRPDRLRWEILEPFRSLLIVSGDRVAKFEWIDGHRRQLRLGRSEDAIRLAMERIRGWFRGEFQQARKDYKVEVTAGKQPRIFMWPKDERLKKTLLRLEFWPTEKLDAMRRVVIREGNGGVTVMKFHGHRQNIQPPKKAFDLKDPEDIALDKLPDGKRD